jgi:archaellum component FlaC
MEHQAALPRLKGDLVQVSTIITIIENGVSSFRTLLQDIDKVLSYPQDIEKDLGRVQSILEALYDVTEVCSVLPEIGSAAGAVAKVLKPLVISPKPPGGVVGEIRSTLKEIDAPLKKFRDELGKIKKPVDDAWSALDKIRLKIAAFEAGVDRLIQEHGNNPPRGVVDCANALSQIIENGLDELNKAENLVTGKLSGILGAMEEVEDAFNNLDGIKHQIERVLGHVTGKAFNSMKSALDKLKADVDKLKDLTEWLFKQVMKSMGIDIGGLQRGLARAEGKIEGFVDSAAKVVVTKARDELVTQLEKIPGIAELEAEVQGLEAAALDLRDSIENRLGESCAKTLGAL